MFLQYLNTAQRDFKHYKTLGEKTFSQLEEDDFFWQFNAESNSIAILVNHLHGNMRSRWTDFLSTDGEKPWRNRDQEFEKKLQTKGAILDQWETGWLCVFDALETLDETHANTRIFIRNQEHSILEAVNRQVAHYAYHVGQIVFIGRMVQGKNWKTLSIAKGASKKFNQQKFSKGKHSGSFTEDLK